MSESPLLPDDSDDVIYETQDDDKVCPICEELAGEEYTIGIDNLPKIPDDTHPNCRCYYEDADSGEPLTPDGDSVELTGALASSELSGRRVRFILNTRQTLNASIERFTRGDNRFFIRAFLLDDSLNKNDWAVTKEAMEHDLSSFKGKPFVMDFASYSHPDESEQENYRVGTIEAVGIDPKSGRAFADIEITSKRAMNEIKAGGIYVSPSLGADTSAVQLDAMGRRLISAFEGFHLAGVKYPAYGVMKAQIKGQCTGSGHECRKQLMMVQACAKCGSFTAADIVEEALGPHDTDRPDSDFAYVPAGEPPSARKFPVYDEAHVRNALARYSQAELPSDKKTAVLGKICSRAKKFGIDSELCKNRGEYDVEEECDCDISDSVEPCECSQNTMADGSESKPAANQNSSHSAMEQRIAQLEAGIKERDTIIASLKADFQAAQKKPLIARIVAAMAALGKIKEEASAEEEKRLINVGQSELELLASGLEAAVETKKEVANASVHYRSHQLNAADEGKTYDDKWMRNLLDGGGY